MSVMKAIIIFVFPKNELESWKEKIYCKNICLQGWLRN